MSPMLLLVQEAAPSPEEAERVARAQRLLRQAIEKGRGKPTLGFQGVRVDKYFGTKLPPVCASLGCYVTDDGKRYYCINPACQKHKIRETKHTRRGRPEKAHFVYFKCPRCDSRSIEMHVVGNKYVCRTCKYNWDR